MQQKTFMAKAEAVERKCYIVDAENKVLGRLAARVADVLRGKHKPIYTPHVDTGDTVIIINADKIRTTGNKLEQKEYNRYSGYPSGRRVVTLRNMLEKNSTTVIRLAVSRMLPKNRLADQIIRKLKIYVDDKHPHQAQKPVTLEI